MRPQKFFSEQRQQCGQAIVWFLATIAACCCAFALVYNVGQVANEKEKTTNAADASALSGALVEARILNFEAYTNRAMVANEVTVAQFVSLDSWLRYDNELFQNIAIYTSLVPYLDDITESVAEATQDAVDGYDEALPTMLKVPEYTNDVLEAANTAVNYAGLGAPTLMAEEIARENSSSFDGQDYQANLVPAFTPLIEQLNYDTWKAFTDDYSGDQRTNAASVMMYSRDVFTAKRGAGELIQDFDYFLKLLGGGVVYGQLVKTSGSTQLKGFNEWEAQDSLDATFSYPSFCVSSIVCENTEWVPGSVAYGRSDADSNNSGGDNLCNVSPSTYNCTMAWQDGGPPVSWTGTNNNGIPNLRDLALNLSKTDPCSKNNFSDSPSLRFVSAVQKSGTATATTQRLGMNSDIAAPEGSPNLTDNLQNGKNMTSISQACTFFLRPDKTDKNAGLLARQDGVHEYASLYNPYWQARLTNPDDSLKQKLYVLIGSPGLDSVTPQPTSPDPQSD